VATLIDTPAGRMHFQHYLVRRHAQDEVLGVAFGGAEAARPAPGVLEAIGGARAVLIAPSNPVVSVGTILAVPGVRQALAATAAPIAAVSPIVGGAPVKGPAAPLMRAMGYEVSALGVARCYQGLAGALVIDTVDAHLADAVRALGMRVAVTDTIMRGPEQKRDLARAALRAASVEC
jgi:LPPG:FO 2-phospho-L-lactate transferase